MDDAEPSFEPGSAVRTLVQRHGGRGSGAASVARRRVNATSGPCNPSAAETAINPSALELVPVGADEQPRAAGGLFEGARGSGRVVAGQRGEKGSRG